MIFRRWLVSILIFLVPATCLAQELGAAAGTVEVAIRSGEELISAYGLVLVDPGAGSPEGALPQVRRRDVRLSRIDETSWKAVVRVIQEDFIPNAKITVVARTVAGKTVSGPVQWLAKADEQQTVVKAKCRSLDDLSALRRLIALDNKKLERVVRIREQKIELLRVRLSRLLSPSVIALVNKLEKALNIKRQPPVSKDLPLEELAARIGAISAMNK